MTKRQDGNSQKTRRMIAGIWFGRALLAIARVTIGAVKLLRAEKLGHHSIMTGLAHCERQLVSVQSNDLATPTALDRRRERVIITHQRCESFNVVPVDALDECAKFWHRRVATHPLPQVVLTLSPPLRLG